MRRESGPVRSCFLKPSSRGEGGEGLNNKVLFLHGESLTLTERVPVSWFVESGPPFGSN